MHKTEKAEAGHDNIFKYIVCYRRELVCSQSQEWTGCEVPCSNYSNVDSGKTLGNFLVIRALKHWDRLPREMM